MNSPAKRVKEIDWSTWHAEDPATLLFVIRNEQVLLIRKKRGLGAGKINGPGGRLEIGEEPLAGAIREVQEELDVTPTDIRFCGENRFQFVDGYSLHIHVFRASGHEGVPRETDEAFPLWTPLSEIPYEEMWEDDRLWFPLMLRGALFDGWYIFEGDSMLDHRVEVRP